MATWEPTREAPLKATIGPYTVYKPGPWSQGPLLLQMLLTLGHQKLSPAEIQSAAGLHLLVEIVKSCFADREAYYGDPKFVDVPLGTLLDENYAQQRRKLIGEYARQVVLPGRIEGYTAKLPTFDEELVQSEYQLSNIERDTSHVSVADRWGNVVSATPSGGWFWGSPTIPDLGFSMNTRAEMFWLQHGLASSLRPGSRPRTTLAPTMVFEGGRPCLAFGTRGADFAEQWQFQFFVGHLLAGLPLQDAIELPCFGSQHWPESEAPRTARPGLLQLDGRIDRTVAAELGGRGHRIKTPKQHRLGRICAVSLGKGRMVAAATGRLSHYSAIGR